MNKTILFFLALVLAATTACGRGSSNNNPVKEETMATEGNGKVIHLTKAEFLAKVYNFEKNPEVADVGVLGGHGALFGIHIESHLTFPPES